MEDIRTWHLDEADIPAAVAKLTKVNERAVKNGLAGRYSWELGGEHHEPVYDEAGARLVINGIPHYLEKGQPVPCPLLYFKVSRDFHVSGDAPKLAGWSFLARLTWDEGVLVTRTTPGYEGRIDDSQIRERECDHCNADRDRRDCYLLENAEGQRVQVGSSCVKDFLGHDFRPGWISYGDDLDAIEHDCSRRETVAAATLEVLTWASSICSQTGWISRAKADADYSTPSGDTLRECLFGCSGQAGRARNAYRPTTEHRAEAATVLAWAQAIEPGDSEYLANVKRLAEADYVGERNTAILGSAVASYHRELTRNAEREARPVSQWFGRVKDKVELAATVRSDTPVEGNYGVRHRYAFTTAEGNSLIWWASSDQRLEVGSKVTVRGTIKGHEEYREVKSTVLTRCKVAEMEAAAQAEAG